MAFLDYSGLSHFLDKIKAMTFQPATSSTDGDTGLVPAPLTGDEDKFLKGDGTWDAVPDGLPEVTSSDNGKILQVVNGEWDKANSLTNVFNDISFSILTTDWTGSNAPYTATVSISDITADSYTWVFYGDEYEQYALAKISSATSVGQITFTTSVKPTGTITGTVRVANKAPMATITAELLNSKLSASEKGAVNGVASLDSAGKVPSTQLPATLPEVTSSDNGKSLDVVNGEWAVGEEKLDVSEKGVANGVASLDSTGKIPSTQLPNMLPGVTSTDNGKSLDVVNGEWAKGKVKLNKYYEDNDWNTKTWNGLTNFSGLYIWFEGDNIYYSSWSSQYVLDKSTFTWSPKTWTGLTSFSGEYVWSDGDNVYYSYESIQYVLDKSTFTWSTKTWNGLTSFTGSDIWSDGNNIYYSDSSDQYVLDKSTSTWSTKAWTGLTSFYGDYIWSDGDNIYYSYNYVLDKSTSTWSSKTWNGLNKFESDYIWSDGDNIYYGNYTTSQYVLDKSTSTWSTKSWTGLTVIRGNHIWSDGDNTYYSYEYNQYVLNKDRNKILLGSNGEFSAVSTNQFIATQAAAGLMPASDKTKLDGVATGATANVVSDSLSDTSTTNALSAAKGKALNDKVGDPSSASGVTGNDAFSKISSLNSKISTYDFGSLTVSAMESALVSYGNSMTDFEVKNIRVGISENSGVFKGYAHFGTIVRGASGRYVVSLQPITAGGEIITGNYRNSVWTWSSLNGNLTDLEDLVSHSDISTVITDLSSIRTNSKGRITLAHEVAPAGSGNYYVNYICYGSSGRKTLEVSNVNRKWISYYDGSSWSSWAEFNTTDNSEGVKPSIVEFYGFTLGQAKAITAKPYNRSGIAFGIWSTNINSQKIIPFVVSIPANATTLTINKVTLYDAGQVTSGSYDVQIMTWRAS